VYVFGVARTLMGVSDPESGDLEILIPWWEDRMIIEPTYRLRRLRAPCPWGLILSLGFLLACTVAPARPSGPLPPPDPEMTGPGDGEPAGDSGADCAEGNCSLVCPSAATCSFSCNGGNCNVRCEEGSTCSSACNGGNCNSTCQPGATCQFACNGGNCSTQCAEGASCQTSCLGGDCS
jgi:hypothetical protein